MLFRSLILLTVIAALGVGSLRADALLFSKHEVLELTIPVDFKTLCRPRESPDCDYIPTVLEYVDEHGQMQSIGIEIIIRGGWRSLAKNCSAPLLFIRFNENETADTPFHGQSVLPLTTHCGQGLSLEASQVRQRRSTWEQYLLREYLGHRLYNLITPVSLNARLVRMTYPHPDKPSRRIVNYAFFTEHFKSVAARNDAELLERHSFDHETLDADAAGLLALFQYMIGTTDWSITRERNIALLLDSEGSQLPLPYDFDMSGLVNAHYAGPAPGLPIDEVRDRYYLGFCQPGTDWDALFEAYLEKEPELKNIAEEVPELGKQNRKSVNSYLKKFFATLRSPESRQRKIVDQCQSWPPSPVDHLTPSEMR